MGVKLPNLPVTAFAGVVVLAAVAIVASVWPRDLGPSAPETVVIGLITNNPNGLGNIEGFRAGMMDLGYNEDENIAFLFSGGPTASENLEGAIKQMVVEGADLIFTAGTPTGIAAKAATRESAVRVVFGVIADPVAASVLSDLNRPGGNMTGVMLSQNQSRRLELLQNILPGIRHVLLPYNPDDPAPVSSAAQLDLVAPELGLSLIHAHARHDDEVSALLANLPENIDAVFMLPDSTVNRRVKDLVAAANARNLPVSGPSAAQVEAGALMAYGIAHYEVGLQAARIADRILRGADPATTPVQTADFYLTLNLAAAQRIGLELSEEILQQADLILHEDQFGQ